MNTWNENHLSERFSRSAHYTDCCLHEVRAQTNSGPAYERLCDDLLAKLYVYRALYGSALLQSRSVFLRGLQTMRSSVPNPTQAFDCSVFANSYRFYLADLVREFGGDDMQPEHSIR